MSTVPSIFELNSVIIIFVYGLIFFALGLVILFQTRRYSRLDLARSITWLGVFGITHGLHEWGDLFILIQRQYLSQPFIILFKVIQLILLAVSFTFLFQFGAALLQPLIPTRWLQGLPSGLLVSWVLIAFFVFIPISPSLSEWPRAANALARYIIGFPGALLAAYGLWEQASKRIAPLNVPHIVRTLRIAGASLGLYAIFGGLMVPPVWFFPGNLINSVTFANEFGVSPLVIRSIIGMVLAVSITQALEIFDVEVDRMVEEMAQHQTLDAERERIARELHDGVIQKVYTAGLLVGSAIHQASGESRVVERLEKAKVVLDDAISDLRRNLVELQAASPEAPLSTALQDLAGDPRYRSLVEINLALNLPEKEALSQARTNHIIAIVQEALSNVVRHSQARKVRIEASSTGGRLGVRIQDDGIGLPPDYQASFGLRNMRDRARLLGGQINLSRGDGKGTLVWLDIPWKDEP